MIWWSEFSFEKAISISPLLCACFYKACNKGEGLGGQSDIEICVDIEKRVPSYPKACPKIAFGVVSANKALRHISKDQTMQQHHARERVSKVCTGA